MLKKVQINTQENKKRKRKKKKGRFNPNAKGGSFERLVSRALTKWITGSEKPEIFWRSASSGAKATQDAKKGHKSKMGGDIVAIDVKGQWFTDAFSVECKNRKNFGDIDLFLEGKGKLLNWWEQCCGDAERSNKIPFMICKRFRGEILAVFPTDLKVVAPAPYISFNKFDGDMIICNFEMWMEANPYLNVKKLFKKSGLQKVMV